MHRSTRLAPSCSHTHVSQPAAATAFTLTTHEFVTVRILYQLPDGGPKELALRRVVGSWSCSLPPPSPLAFDGGCGTDATLGEGFYFPPFVTTPLIYRAMEVSYE